MSKQIEALKLALENSHKSMLMPGWTLVRNEDFAAIREALADHSEQHLDMVQPAQQQEPVALVVDPYDTPGLQWLCQQPPKRGDRLYTSPPQQQEHITDGTPCWCNPVLDYKDPDTGAEVWIHKEPQ